MASGPIAIEVFNADVVAAAFVRSAGVMTPIFDDELMTVANKVRDSARSKISRYRGASLGTIQAKVRPSAVWVVQDAKKVTGKRGDFGALQMRKGFIPALREHEPEVTLAAERAAVRSAGAGGLL